jgi:hypothetical protein
MRSISWPNWSWLLRNRLLSDTLKTPSVPLSLSPLNHLVKRKSAPIFSATMTTAIWFVQHRDNMNTRPSAFIQRKPHPQAVAERSVREKRIYGGQGRGSTYEIHKWNLESWFLSNRSEIADLFACDKHRKAPHPLPLRWLKNIFSNRSEIANLFACDAIFCL